MTARKETTISPPTTSWRRISRTRITGQSSATSAASPEKDAQQPEHPSTHPTLRRCTFARSTSSAATAVGHTFAMFARVARCTISARGGEVLGLVGLAGRNAHVHLISCGCMYGMCISHTCVRMYMYTYNVMFAYVHM